MTKKSKTEEPSFEGWCILELMGHRKLGGYLREVQIAGAGMIRIDVPARSGKGDVATQFYSPAAVYAITPVGEEVARKTAAACQPEPVTRWELPAPASATRGPGELEDES